MDWAIVVFGALSAVAWLTSAVLTPAVMPSYWDGPPKHLVRRLRIGSACNAAGALFAAIAIGCQAWLTYVSIGAAS